MVWSVYFSLAQTYPVLSLKSSSPEHLSVLPNRDAGHHKHRWNKGDRCHGYIQPKTWLTLKCQRRVTRGISAAENHKWWASNDKWAGFQRPVRKSTHCCGRIYTLLERPRKHWKSQSKVPGATITNEALLAVPWENRWEAVHKDQVRRDTY